MNKRKVIQAISDCADPRDHRAGLGDICQALGKSTNQEDISQMTEMLRNKYSDYVVVDSYGSAVTVKPLTHAESERNKKRQSQLLQWLLATATAIAGYFLGKLF